MHFRLGIHPLRPEFYIKYLGNIVPYVASTFVPVGVSGQSIIRRKSRVEESIRIISIIAQQKLSGKVLKRISKPSFIHILGITLSIEISPMGKEWCLLRVPGRPVLFKKNPWNSTIGGGTGNPSA
jgi:hypothetical protein